VPFLLVVVLAAAAAVVGVVYFTRGFDEEETGITEPTPSPDVTYPENGEIEPPDFGIDPDPGNGEEPPANGEGGYEEPNGGEGDEGPNGGEGGEDPNGDGGEEPGDEPDYDADVRVLNNSGITGEAGRGAAALEARGFTNTTPANFTGGGAPSATSVWYAEGYAATAARIAAILGIDPANVLQQSPPAGAVAVVIQGALTLP